MNETFTYNLKEFLAQPRDVYENILPGNLLTGVQEIAGAFPLVSAIGFKCHLNAPAPRTGFMIGLRYDEFCSAEFFKEYDMLCNNNGWPAVADLYRHRMQSTPVRCDEMVWFNFAINADKKVIPAPAVFFDMDCEGVPYTATCMQDLSHSLKKLGRPFTAGEKDIVISLLHTSHKPRLHYAGLIPGMLPVLRLCFTRLQHYNVWPFLRETYGNNINPFRNKAKHLLEHADKLVVHMDIINGRPGDNIGIEVFFEEEQKWDDFFEKLIAGKLCSESEMENIRAFTGTERIPDDALRHYLSMATGKETRFFHRRLNHVKLSYNPQTGLTAKAYLYACYC